MQQVDLEELIALNNHVVQKTDKLTGEITIARNKPKFKTHYSNTRVDGEVIDGEHMTNDIGYVPIKTLMDSCMRTRILKAGMESIQNADGDEGIDYTEENGFDLADMPAVIENEKLKADAQVQLATTTTQEKAEQVGAGDSSVQAPAE